MEKTFVLHVQGGARLPVLHGVSLAVGAGECVVLADPSGSGKSTLLRSVYGNYKPQAGEILVRHAGGDRGHGVRLAATRCSTSAAVPSAT